MWRSSSSTLRTYLNRKIISAQLLRQNSPTCSFSSHIMSPSLLSPLSKSEFGFFPNKVSLNSDKKMKMIGHAMMSTSAGDINGEKQAVKQKDIREAKTDQVADMKILSTLVKTLWSRDNLEFRLRVIAALGFLVGAKVLNVQVPFLFKLAVDWLTTATGNANALASFTAANSYVLAFFVSPAAVLLGYGIARTGASAFNGFCPLT